MPIGWLMAEWLDVVGDAIAIRYAAHHKQSQSHSAPPHRLLSIVTNIATTITVLIDDDEITGTRLGET